MTGIMGQPGITIWPFLSRKGGGQLIIGISGEERVMRLWFQVDDKRPVDRNPFAPGQAAPRTLAWRCSGLDALPQVQDETHGLSHSGFITFTFPEGFGESDGGCGLPLRRYLGGGGDLPWLRRGRAAQPGIRRLVPLPPAGDLGEISLAQDRTGRDHPPFAGWGVPGRRGLPVPSGGSRAKGGGMGAAGLRRKDWR